MRLAKFVSAPGLIFLLGLAACSNDAENQGGALYCTASSTSAITTAVNASIPVQIYATGGSGSYTVTGLQVAGISATSVSGATTFSGSTSVTGYFPNLTTVTGLSGTATIADSSGSSTSCTFTFNSSPTVNNGCTITPSTTTPSVNQAVSLTLTGTTGWGTAPYTFSSLSPGGGIVVTPITAVSTTSASAAVQFTVSGSQTISAVVTDALGRAGSCSTVVNVGGTGTGTGTCAISHVVNGNSVSYSVYSTTGGTVTLSNFSPGDGGSYSVLSNPVIAYYSTSGVKNATAIAYVNGVPCNGNGYVYDTVTVGGTSGGGGLTYCQAIINPNPSTRGTYVNAYIQVPAGVTGYLGDVMFPANAGISGYYTGAQSAALYFAYPGTYQITMIANDAYGNQVSCQTTQTVY